MKISKIEKMNDKIRDSLAPHLGDDSEAVFSEIENGNSELYAFGSCGLVVTRVEIREGENAELVIVVGVGQKLSEVVGHIADHAARQGWTTRLHSKRRGMFKMLEPLGFELSETIYRRVL